MCDVELGRYGEKSVADKTCTKEPYTYTFIYIYMYVRLHLSVDVQKIHWLCHTHVYCIYIVPFPLLLSDKLIPSLPDDPSSSATCILRSFLLLFLSPYLVDELAIRLSLTYNEALRSREEPTHAKKDVNAHIHILLYLSFSLYTYIHMYVCIDVCHSPLLYLCFPITHAINLVSSVCCATPLKLSSRECSSTRLNFFDSIYLRAQVFSRATYVQLYIYIYNPAIWQDCI